MARYQILFWHDIPLQVRAHDGDGRRSVPLPERFQEAVDRAAMAAGLHGGDAYTAGLRWGERLERDGPATQVAAEIAAELDAAMPTIDWQATARRLRDGNADVAP
jgi:hypothetical protein